MVLLLLLFVFFLSFFLSLLFLGVGGAFAVVVVELTLFV